MKKLINYLILLTVVLASSAFAAKQSDEVITVRGIACGSTGTITIEDNQGNLQCVCDTGYGQVGTWSNGEPMCTQNSSVLPAPPPPVYNPPPSFGEAPPVRCPWKPKRIPKPAAGYCGFSDIGLPKPGLYDCGLVPNKSKNACENYCAFVECQKI